MPSKRYIMIDSSDNNAVTSEQTHSSIQITLPHPIHLDQNSSNRLKLNHFSLANTIYNITSKNNTMVVNATTITLPVGSYNSSAFLTAIQTQLTAIHVNFFITLSTLTYKVTIRRSDSVNFTMTFGSELNERLGYRSTSYSGASTYTTENIYNLSDNELYVSISGSGIGVDTITTNPNYNNVSYVIPVQVDTPYVIIFNANANFSQSIPITGSINHLNITLTGRNRELLSGVGNFNMILEII